MTCQNAKSLGCVGTILLLEYFFCSRKKLDPGTADKTQIFWKHMGIKHQEMCQKTGDSRPHIFQHGQKTRCLVRICFPMANLLEPFLFSIHGKIRWQASTDTIRFIVQFMGNSCYRKKKNVSRQTNQKEATAKKNKTQGALKLHHGPESHITRFAGLTTCGSLKANHTSACFHH